MNRILVILICVIMALNSVIFNANASMEEWDESVEEKVQDANSLEISADSAVLMDAETGTVLYVKNGAEALPPASVTKIMTLLLVAEALSKKVKSSR